MPIRAQDAVRLLLAQMNVRLPTRVVGGPAQKSLIRTASVVSGQRPLLPQPVILLSRISHWHLYRVCQRQSWRNVSRSCLSMAQMGR